MPGGVAGVRPIRAVPYADQSLRINLVNAISERLTQSRTIVTAICVDSDGGRQEFVLSASVIREMLWGVNALLGQVEILAERLDVMNC
jgi:hypothetical protein